MARAIFNGKLLNNGPAPPINTPTTQDLLDKIARLPELDAKGILTAEIRHWSHQIPVVKAVSHFFAVKSGTQWFRWRALPMGTSWSPYVAQCFAWCLIIDVLATHAKQWPFKLKPTEVVNQPPPLARTKGRWFHNRLSR
jgi:hypothetical protein